MAQHMILGMLVPILLVAGCASRWRCVPCDRQGATGRQGRGVAAVRRALAAGALADPPLVTLPVRGSYYALYFSGCSRQRCPALGAPADEPALPAGRAGVLLALVGVDPAPRRLPPRSGWGWCSPRCRSCVLRVALMSANSVIGGTSTEPRSALGARSAARPAARRGTGVGVRRAATAARGHRVAHPVVPAGRTVGPAR